MHEGIRLHTLTVTYSTFAPFEIKKYVTPTECIYGFRMALGIRLDDSVNRRNRAVFMTGTGPFPCHRKLRFKYYLYELGE
jgi:hypothetical protein